jgi:hypothetical protein
MQNQRAPSPYRFKRAKTDGLILVMNEGSYVMAEYSEHTGVVAWQRVMLATQREAVENQLRAQFPAKVAMAAAEPKSPQPAPRGTRTK